jgi:hypothetical protein
MSSVSETDTGLSKRAERRARKHAEYIIEELPPAGVRHVISAWADEWYLDADWAGPYESLARVGVLRTTEVVESPQGNGDRAHIRVLVPAAARIARERLRTGYTPCPCGHRGLRNPADIEGYRCQWGRCSATFDRDELGGDDENRPGYTEATLLGQIGFLADGDEPPTLAEMNAHDETPSGSAYQNHFDSWNDAVERAGFKPRPPGVNR